MRVPTAIAIAALLTLCGCATITVDEAFVFRPQPDPNATTIAQELEIAWEDAFTGTEPVSIEIEAWDNQRVSIMLDEEQLAPAKVHHSFLAPDSAPIAYTLITTGMPDRPLIVHCGGNTASRRTSGTPYGLKALPFGDVLLFDYPGYGDSPGVASPESLSAMNDTVAAFAKDLTQDGRPLVLWGHSLGGFVCADLATRLPGADAVIFETSARNAREVASTVPPWFLKPFIRINIAESLTHFDNVDILNGQSVPMLVIGARKDKTLPVHLSRSLADDLKASGHDVQYHEFPDANHISVAAADGFEPVLQGFLTKADILPPLAPAGPHPFPPTSP